MNITTSNSFIIINQDQTVAKGTFNVIRNDNSVFIKSLNGQVMFEFIGGETQINGVPKTNTEVYLFLLQNSGLTFTSNDSVVDLSDYLTTFDFNEALNVVNLSIEGKADDVHSHNITDIEGLTDTLSDKADASHGHSISDVNNLQSTLNSKANNSDITTLQLALDGKANNSHTHTIANITNLQSTLDSKANNSHTHTIANITNLQSTLDSKANTSHNHNINDLNGTVNLDKLPVGINENTVVARGVGGNIFTPNPLLITDAVNLGFLNSSLPDVKKITIITNGSENNRILLNTGKTGRSIMNVLGVIPMSLDAFTHPITSEIHYDSPTGVISFNVANTGTNRTFTYTVIFAPTPTWSLDENSFTHVGGNAYKFEGMLNNGDIIYNPSIHTLKLYENGVELTQINKTETSIVDNGSGRWRCVGVDVIFSSSDNSNPITNGRTYSYEIIETEIIGYAMVGGVTTGGGGGGSVTVNTLADLKTNLYNPEPLTIYVEGNFVGSGSEYVVVTNNKTIIGRNNASLTGLCLNLDGKNNVIIRNLTFRNYVTQPGILIKNKAHHIWVDHCDFACDRENGWDYWGKDITITRESDFVTVSWCKFHDTNLSLLISGGVGGHELDIGKLNVTLHHNMWYNVSEREPSMNYGRVHMLNNYHLDNAGYSIGTRAGGIVRTDGEVFVNCALPIRTKIASDPDGYISGLANNLYINCGANQITTPESDWVPPYSYSEYLHDTSDVIDLVNTYAGATL